MRITSERARWARQLVRAVYQALKANGVETQMVIYPDEGHPIKQLPHQEDVLTRVLEWFGKHDVEGEGP